MKKLLITSMAAVAVSICAKAEFTANESFEEYTNEGPLFPVAEDTGKYIYGEDWTSEATPEDGIFTVTNISKITSVGDSYPTDRPLDGDNANALAIDTEKSLIRRVIPGASSTNLEGALLEGEGGAPIFFDSVVQFTATDAKPTPGNDDKLMVWLYASDDVDNDNPGVFGETTPTTNLIITASYNESGTFVVTNYLTGVEIAPDSWHRLTIKSFKDSGYLKFNVWVDKTLVTVGTESDFISLQYAPGNVDGTLKGVAFEGKGVVDDLVFTTTAPEFAEGGGEEPEAKNFTLKFTIDAAEEAGAQVLNVVADGTDYEATEDGFILGVDVSSVVAQIYCAPGYKVIGAEEGEEDLWILPVDVTSAVAGGEITCNVTVVEDSGSGSDVEYPTVVPEEGAELTIPLSSDANKAIKDAFTGMTADDMPEKLTVVINEQEYKNDAAIQMINDVVDMFELSDGNKYFDNNGLMKVSFKATNPLLDAETADAEDYEAKVGEATATVRATYTVKKQPVDLTPDVSGENEPVIFKLVIRPAEVQ